MVPITFAYFADAGAIRERKNPSPCCINALFLYSSQSIQLAGFGFFWIHKKCAVLIPVSSLYVCCCNISSLFLFCFATSSDLSARMGRGRKCSDLMSTFSFEGFLNPASSKPISIRDILKVESTCCICLVGDFFPLFRLIAGSNCAKYWFQPWLMHSYWRESSLEDFARRWVWVACDAALFLIVWTCRLLVFRIGTSDSHCSCKVKFLSVHWS